MTAACNEKFANLQTTKGQHFRFGVSISKCVTLAHARHNGRRGDRWLADSHPPLPCVDGVIVVFETPSSIEAHQRMERESKDPAEHIAVHSLPLKVLSSEG